MLLPDNVVAYKRTAVFDQDTMPAGLCRNHRTASGVWAVLHILEGELLYRTAEPPSETLVGPDTPMVIAPQAVHEVELRGPVRFFVEFYSKPKDAAADPHDGSVKNG